MRLFMCFGGSAADGGIEAAVVAARHRRGSSFRGKFLSGSRKGNTKKPTAAATSPPAGLKKREVDANADAYGLIPAPAASSSVPSSAALSSALSLDSNSSSASSSSRSSALAPCSSVSSSPSVSRALFPPPAAKRQASKKGSSTTTSSAAGAAAVVLCLMMVVLCGRVGATVLTSTALYFFPRRWPARLAREEDGVGSPQCDAEAGEETAKRKVVTITVTVTERGSW